MHVEEISEFLFKFLRFTFSLACTYFNAFTAFARVYSYTQIFVFLALSEMLQLSLDLAKNRIGSVSQDIRKLFVNIMANLIEKSTVCC